MSSQPNGYVDPRGTRFGSFLTLLGASAVLITQWTPLAYLWAAIVLVAAAAGGRYNLWAYAYRYTLRRFLKPPSYLEPSAPPRFAQFLAGAFLVGGGVTWDLGAALVGAGLIGVVALLALVNAAFGYCVGCRLYGLLVRRPASRRAASGRASPPSQNP